MDFLHLIDSALHGSVNQADMNTCEGSAMWRYANPVTIRFGAGVMAQIGEVLGGRSYALVTYGEPRFRDLGEKIAGFAGRPQAVIDDIAPNPSFRDMRRLCPRLAPSAGGPEVLVALGGGSVIDAAKAIAAADGDFSVVEAFLKHPGGETGLASRPIIAIPTTAGTGSEVTCWAALWDTEAGRKYSLAHSSLYPEAALVDPTLLLELPRGLTVSTGLDALSHALESLWNKNANPVSRVLAVAAARELLASLPAAADAPGDLALRSRVAKAAVLAGLAFSNTKTALAHSLSYPITLNHGVPHGIACSFSLPMVMRSVLGADADCDAALSEIFGPELAAAPGRLTDFLATLGVSPAAADHGVVAEEWEGLVADAFEGERGQNFIGTLERFLESAERQGGPITAAVRR